MSDHQQLLYSLLRSEHEDEIVKILESAGYPLDDQNTWYPLGENAGNFSTVGNQQDDPAGALIEKVINSIDAVLMGECHRAGIDPECDRAPSSMREAVERFFGIRDGRLDNLDSREQTLLADRIHVVATGTKQSPCYSVIDRGEGQTPDKFPDTFLSTTRSSPKIKIGFVQGKFNAGGSGSLQFCGQHNIQLIVSRRQTYASNLDDSANQWGFTVVRRKRPTSGERSSVFVYLAPRGRVLRFSSDHIDVLPGGSRKNEPPAAYVRPLDYGTIVKLYNYQFGGRGIATLEAKRELERALHTPCLPYRITETRKYRANYYATTITDIWGRIEQEGEADEVERVASTKMEHGFPAYSTLNLHVIGSLPLRIGVWRARRKTRETARRLTTGVVFLVNGQRHGQLSRDFLSRLGLDYIKDHLLVGVDCTNIDRHVFEDLFMTSRDRLRQNRHYAEIRQVLQRELRGHHGLRELNSVWRRQQVDEGNDPSTYLADLMNKLIRDDPGLSHLFSDGDKILNLGPSVSFPYKGRKFPTYFQLAKSQKRVRLRKDCPINGTVRLEFDTDAENQYFVRADSPGKLMVDPSVDLIERSNLWNGRFVVHFRVPWNARVGDVTRIHFSVSDVERMVSGPFVTDFELVAAPERVASQSGSDGASSRGRSRNTPNEPGGQLPHLIPITKEKWGQGSGIDGPFDALRIRQAPDGGYDFFFNDDCQWLIKEKADPKNNPARVAHWFSWGLTLAALGMIRRSKSAGSAREPVDSNPLDLKEIQIACDGIAQVIIPMFRTIYPGAPAG